MPPSVRQSSAASVLKRRETAALYLWLDVDGASPFGGAFAGSLRSVSVNNPNEQIHAAFMSSLQFRLGRRR